MEILVVFLGSSRREIHSLHQTTRIAPIYPSGLVCTSRSAEAPEMINMESITKTRSAAERRIPFFFIYSFPFILIIYDYTSIFHILQVCLH